MKKEYTNIRIKVDKFTVGDYETIRHLAIKHDVPDRACVEIDISGLGTYISFEWRDESTLSDKEKIDLWGYKSVAKKPHVYPKDQWRNYYKK
jgi:hypothetical protein